MTYNTLSITGTNILTDHSGEAVIVTLTALSPYVDTASNVEINPQPVTAISNVNGNWILTGILDPTPDGSGIPWKLAIRDKNSGTTIYSRDVQPAFSRGASQHWLSLTVPPPVAGIAPHVGPQAVTGPQDLPISELDGRFVRVVSVKAAPFYATGNGVADDTRAVQAAINYATAINAVTFFPSSGPASYRVSQLVIPTGAILEGVSSGTYPANESIAGVSTLARLGGTNSDLLSIPDGNNYCRIRDIQIDGNKKNNTTGDGIHISTGAAGQEGQIVIERCYVHDNPGHNIYLGHYRRANKVLNSVCNYAGKDGICVAGSDNTVAHNICGTNARAGINLGTSNALRWAADAGQTSAAVTHVISNDIYGNLVGINVSSGSWGNVISSNGIDRNSNEGIAVFDGNMSATILANVLHSNSRAADDAYPHIGLGVGVATVEITANIFAACDAGLTNMPSYGVHAASSSTHVHGDLGIIDSNSTNHGLS